MKVKAVFWLLLTLAMTVGVSGCIVVGPPPPRVYAPPPPVVYWPAPPPPHRW